MEAREYEGAALRYIVVEPDGFDPSRPYPLVVLLHGFGASMRDLVGLSPSIDRSGYICIFPNAPIEIEIGPGMKGYAWTTIGPGSSPDEAARAERMLEVLIEEVRQRYGEGERSMVLGGFSQGGMMTYRYGMPNPELFAGLAVLSGGVDGQDELRDRLPAHRDQPIFIAHGTEDGVIPVSEARRSLRFLKEEGYTPEYHEYAIGHEITHEVVQDFREWTRSVLPPAPDDVVDGRIPDAEEVKP